MSKWKSKYKHLPDRADMRLVRLRNGSWSTLCVGCPECNVLPNIWCHNNNSNKPICDARKDVYDDQLHEHLHKLTGDRKWLVKTDGTIKDE